MLTNQRNARMECVKKSLVFQVEVPLTPPIDRQFLVIVLCCGVEQTLFDYKLCPIALAVIQNGN